MKVLILGASGFIGARLVAALQTRQDEVATASLRDPRRAAALAADTDVVVNLAGESIAQRWTARAKAAISSSRTDAPRIFIDALLRLPHRPRRYISASAVGYYGISRDEIFDERSPPGKDFLAGVCLGWEREASRVLEHGIALSILRTGVVLGSKGGMMAKVLPIFKAGGGGVVGDGGQWYSWIHIDDIVGLYLYAIDGAEGIYNATAPTPVTNRDFTAVLSRAVHRPAILPVPAFALNLLLGEGAVIALEGQRVIPQRALDAGYSFRYAEIEGALRSLV
jgi:uncharacterized protein (TIGR01777 family)